MNNFASVPYALPTGHFALGQSVFEDERWFVTGTDMEPGTFADQWGLSTRARVRDAQEEIPRWSGVPFCVPENTWYQPGFGAVDR